MADLFSVLDKLSAAGSGLVLRPKPYEFALAADAETSSVVDTFGRLSHHSFCDLFSKRRVERLV